MSEIRKEYKNFKLINEEKLAETENWLSENVIFINERIDRGTLHRLNSSIARFEEKFGPYRSKLPAIAKVLADAEKGLYVVITGNASKKSAGHMLERMSLLYNIFSDFFGRDLTTLLKTPVFRAACSSPDNALNTIEHPEHNHRMVKRCFVAALRPDRKEKDIFDRVYKNIPMPSMNWNDAAKQLMCLSVNDLRALSEVEKVPAVVVSDVEPETTTLQEQIMQDIEQRPEFQNLQRQLSEMMRLAEQYNMDQRIKDNMRKMSDDLIELIRNQTTSSQIGDIATTIFTLGIKDSPLDKLLKQAVMVVQTFAVLKRTWDQNKELFKTRFASTRTLSSSDKDAIEKLFDRALERGGQMPGTISRFFGRLDFTRTEPYPGLEPETLRNEFMKVVERDLQVGSTDKPRPAGAFIITYDDNAAAGDPERDQDTYIPGAPGITLPGIGTMTKPNKTFNGWSTQRVGGSKIQSPYRPTGDITLYARWV